MCIFLVALPWLNPFAPGPTPATLQFLLSWSFLAFLVQLLVFSGRCPSPSSIARGWLVAAIASSVLAVLQFGGLGDAWMPWVNAAHPGEAFANLRQRNQLASLTNIGLITLLCLRGSENGIKVWQLAIAVLLGAGNASSSSRTGLVQLLSVVAVVCFLPAWRTPVRRKLALATLFSYGLATLALPMLFGEGFGTSGLLNRFEDSSACASRWVLWRNVLHLIELKPLTGWGWGELDFAHFVTLFPTTRFCEILDNAHNLPLHLAVELGLPIALLGCGLVIGYLLRSRPWREQDPLRQLAWGVLTVIFLHCLLEYPLWYGPFQVAVVLCVSWLMGTHRLNQERSSGGSSIPGTDVNTSNAGRQTGLFPQRAVAFVVSGAVMLMSGYAWWDYHRLSQIYLEPENRSAAYRHNTLEKVRSSWLFRDQVQFAELSITPVTPENADAMYVLAHTVLHFSPEAKVVEKLIQSARASARDNEAVFFETRYKAAYPEAYERWSLKQR